MFFIEWLYKRYNARKEEKRLANIARIARMQYQLDTQPKNESDSYPHSIADILTEEEYVAEAVRNPYFLEIQQRKVEEAIEDHLQDQADAFIASQQEESHWD